MKTIFNHLKNALLITLSLFITNKSFAQSYIIPKSGVKVEYVDNGFLYDSGFENNYENNSTGVITLIPNIIGKHIKLTPKKFLVETCCDYIEIFDGASTSSPLIGTYSVLTEPIFALNPSGILTIRFISNNSTVNDGLEAIIESVYDYPKSDLIIKDIQNQNTSVSSGSSLNNSILIQNNGIASSGNVTIKRFLSIDNQFDSTDILLSQNSINSISSGSIITNTELINIPSNIQTGEYFILSYITTVEEFDENNNSNYIPITILNNNHDISVSDFSISYSPTGYKSGNTYNYTFTNENIGNNNISNYKSKLFLSIDNTLDSNDITLDSSNLINLASHSSTSFNSNFQIPITISEGYYSLIYLVDSPYQIMELNENNNIYSQTIFINNPSTDFSLSSNFAKINVATGSLFDLNLNITYSKSESVYVTVQQYLSADSTLDNNDFNLGSSLIQVNGQYNNYVKSFNVQLPNLPVNSNYYIISKIDPLNSFLEDDESNNSCILPIRIISAIYDEKIENTSLSNNKPIIGSQVNFSCLVRNSGNLVFNSNNLGIFLSLDNQLDFSDQLLISKQINQLQPDGSSTISANVTIPLTIVPGNYFVFYVADYQNIIYENDENNNLDYKPIEIQAKTYDLSFELVQSNSTAIKNGTVYVKGKVHNNGNTISSNSQFKIYLSSDSTITGDDVVINSNTVSGIQSGNSVMLSFNFSFVSNITNGNYFMLFHVDANNQINELNELNNITVKPLLVTDSIVDFHIFQSNNNSNLIKTNKNLYFYYNLINEGNVTSSITQATIYLSKDSLIDSLDMFLSNVYTPQYIPGNLYNQFFQINIPFYVESGKYHLLIIIDENNSTSELNENNNFIDYKVDVKQIKLDLSVDKYHEKNLVQKGISTTQIIKTYMIGNDNTVNCQFNLYLSSDSIYSSDDSLVGNMNVPSFYSYTSSNINYTIPSNKINGNYYLLGVLDESNVNFDSDLSNNFLIQPIEVINPKTDLILTRVSNQTHSLYNNTTNYEGSFYYIGKSTLNSARLGIYLSNDSILDVNDNLIQNNLFSNIVPNYSVLFENYFFTNSNLPLGEYYLIYKIDYNSAIIENNENNNILFQKWTIGSYNDSNYVMPKNGKSIIYSCNSFLFDNGKFYDYTFPSNDTITIFPQNNNDKIKIDFTFLDLGSNAYMKIFNGPTVNDSLIGIFFTNPGSISSSSLDGSLTLVINASNYSFGGGFECKIQCTQNILYPDLNYKSVNINKDTISNNKTLEIYSLINNSGEIFANSFFQDTYLSRDSILSIEDSLIKKEIVSNLLPFNTENIYSTINFNDSTLYGRYYIISILDKNNNLIEINESNNIFINPIFIQNPLLELENLTLTINYDSTTNNSFLQIQNIISNVSEKKVNTDISYYFSNDQYLDVSDTLIKKYPLNNLMITDAYYFSIDLDIPNSISNGEYYLITKIDNENTLAETNELNNIKVIKFKIVDPSYEASVSSIALNNDSIVPGKIISNNGYFVNNSITYSSFKIGYFLSTDTIFDTSDIFIQDFQTNLTQPHLGFNVNSNITIPLTIQSGEYYILNVIDYTNEFQEINELNNVGFKRITVMPINYDVKVESVKSVKYYNIRGGELNLYSRIDNKSNNNVNVQVKIYLSNDNALDQNDLMLDSNNLFINEFSYNYPSFDMHLDRNIDTGKYFVFLTIDEPNIYIENNETDNILSTEIEIIEYDIDLNLISKKTSKNVVFDNEALNITYFLNNNGSDNIDSIEVNAYLSNDSILDSSDSLLKTYQHNISKKSISNLYDFIILANNNFSGFKYIIFKVNPNNEIEEVNYNNNINFLKFEIKSSFTDLTTKISNIQNLNNNISFKTTVFNYSNKDLYQNPLKLKYYLCSEPSLNSNALYLGESNSSNIVYKFGKQSFNFSFSNNLITGDHQYIISIVNEDSLILENNYTNNYFSHKILNFNSNDLFIDNLNIHDKYVSSNEIVYLQSKIYKSGLRMNTTASYKCFISNDSILSLDDNQLLDTTILNLTVNYYLELINNIQIPNNLSNGNYFLIGFIDYENNVFETNDLNNSFVYKITVLDNFADGSLLNPVSNKLITSLNENISLFINILNSGKQTFTNGEVECYLSLDSIIDNTDHLLGQSNNILLNYLEKDTLLINTQIPSNCLPGTWKLIFSFDKNNSINELNESNNNVYLSIEILELNPDLLVENILCYEDTVIPGDSLNVIYSVYNQGNDSSGLSKTGFYISTDYYIDNSDIFLKEELINNLNPSEIIDMNSYITIPNNTPIGNYYLLAYQDWNNQIMESEEANNIRYIPIVVVENLNTELIDRSKTINLFPNPTSDKFQIQFDEIFSGTILITDIKGNEVYSNNYNSIELINITLNDFSNGFYIVQLSNENMIYKKLIIKN